MTLRTSIATAHRDTTERSRAEGREFIVLMTALMACGAISIDVMLPAFPDIRQEFGMAPDSTRVSWLITAFFLGMAVGPWLYGPISDKHGRRRPLVFGLVLFVVAAAIAALAPSWGWVIAARFLWGVGAAAPRAMSVTMIRDRYEGSEMARLMSMIMAVFLLVPILAPGIGAILLTFLPWRAVFWAPAIIGVALFAWSLRLPETLADDKRRPFTWRAVGAAGREVITTKQTVAFTIAIVFLFGIMTTYLASSEVIFDEVYGYSEWFPVIFGVIAVVFALNSLLNARLVRLHGIDRLVRRSVAIGTTTAIAFLLVTFATDGRPNFWIFCLGVCSVVPIAQGLGPICNSAAMTPVPHVAGTASAIVTTVTTAGGSLLGSLGSSSFDGTVRSFTVYLIAYFTIATGLIVWATNGSRETA